MKTTLSHQERGFTLVDVLLMVAAFSILTFVFLPDLTRRRHTMCRMACSNNLKQIGLAFKVWALDNNDKFPMQVAVTNGGTMELVDSGSVYVHFLVMSNELSTPRLLICPKKQTRIGSQRAPFPRIYRIHRVTLFRSLMIIMSVTSSQSMHRKPIRKWCLWETETLLSMANEQRAD